MPRNPVSTAQAIFKTGLALDFVKRAARLKPKWPKPPALGAPVSLRFEGLEQHRCFGCSHNNPIGLKLSFHHADGWGLACAWKAEGYLENYPGMVHGGIVATVLDEIIGQALFHEIGHLPVSISAKVEWFKPVKIGDALTAAARMTSRYGALYSAEAFLFRADGKVAAKARGRYYTPALEQFRRMAELDSLPDVAKAWFAPHRSAGAR